MRKLMWLKGIMLGIAVFVISLFIAIYQRSRHGLSTRFSELSSIWVVLVVYLAVCLAAGCLIYSVASFVRQRSCEADIECMDEGGVTRLALPPRVANAIAAQRDSLTARRRSNAAKALALARKERGELPEFMRKKQKKSAAARASLIFGAIY